MAEVLNGTVETRTYSKVVNKLSWEETAELELNRQVNKIQERFRLTRPPKIDDRNEVVGGG